MIKILIVRLSAIGDIFHTLTILPDLHQIFQQVEIDWLIDENFTDIAKLSPLINNIIPIPLKKWKKHKLSFVNNIIKFKQSLPKANYDYIIDTQGLIKTALITKYLFNGDIYGLDRYSAREQLASWFYDYKFNVMQNEVAVVRLRGLIAKIFNLKHDLRKYQFVLNYASYKLPFDNYVLFIHGASKENKKWSLDNWVNLSNWIIQNSDKQIIVTYSNDAEFNFVHLLQSQLNSSRLTIIDKLPFDKLVYLVKCAKLAIGVDTGLTHLANLLHIPTLAIYQSTDPNYVGIIESSIAKNIGGKNLIVSLQDVISKIQGLNQSTNIF